MTQNEDRHMPSDELLVAFMDGELGSPERERIEKLIDTDERVAERFDFLSRSNLPFSEAFQPLLDNAPAARLGAMLTAIPATSERKVSAGMSRRSFFAAAAACLVAGIAIDQTIGRVGRQLSKPDDAGDWRAVVAEYLALYTTDTLSAPPGDRNAQMAQLVEVGSKLGLPLTPETVALPGVDFRRAQVLEYDGKPLAQIAYLDPETGPMALCVIPSDKGAKAPDMERRRGMNVVYWSNATHAFMLIGHDSADRMKELADSVRGRLTA
jgi:anti-sigma factor RsiW